MMWMLGLWIFGRKDAKEIRPEKTKQNGANEKRPKKGGILTLSKIGICNQKQGS